MKKITTPQKPPAKQKEAYHHGDLRITLLATATEMVNELGINGLSLRKLAERIGVSRTAAYHHFKDKNDLLSAIAAQGFITWQLQSEQIFNNDDLSAHDKYREFVHAYVNFATDNPSLYDLMFGSTLWKENNSSDLLKEIAYPSFQYQVEMTKTWQAKGLMSQKENTLRLAQVSWGTLHGIARLVIDGIYADSSNIDEMCDCVVNLFSAH